MSSDEDSHDTDRPHTQTKAHKKRRMRACDMCRRRKVRCDGGVMPGNTCSNCVAFKYKCTYVETAAKRLPDAGYVESLETQLAEMRKTLNKYRQLCPSVPFTDDPSNSSRDSHSQSPFPDDRPALASTSALPPSACGIRTPVDTDDLDPSDDEVTARKTLAESFDDIKLYPGHDHFLGKSSSLMFLQTAIDMRQEYVVRGPEMSGTEGGTEGVGEDGFAKEGREQRAGREKPLLFHVKRPEFWNEHSWIMRSIAAKPIHLEFPDADLIDALVDLYFTEFNLYMPLLHRPSFMRDLREGLHRRDVRFGCILLLVCAVGARFSNDPRVLLDGEDGGGGDGASASESKTWHANGADGWGPSVPEPSIQQHSAGWKWFSQVQGSKSLFNMAPPHLYDLQIICLASLFIHGTSAPHISWQFVGIGIRYALDLGAHRKKVYNAVPSVEDELLKRAFWLLVYLDRAVSSVLGRPCAIQDEDFDVDLPIECDDDYWTNGDPALAFKQPAGKPSTVVFFNCAIRLTQIHAFALRTIYSINKSKALLGFVGPQWEQHIVAELDSALNRWIDSVPDHLRWNPHMENLVFLNQSAHLYASYYTLQITVHRPFIPSPRKPAGLSFPSLAICTNAARSCIHVLDIHAKRAGITSYLNQMALFSSGIVLLLNIWGAKRSGSVADPVKEMKEVHKAMNMLKALEPRWYSAGRVWDILYDLANVGDLPLPDRENPPSHKKRARRSASPAVPSPASEDARMADESRHIAGTRRVQQYQQHASSPSGSGASGGAGAGDMPFSLPIHSDELGRLPLHPFFAMSPTVTGMSVPAPAPIAVDTRAPSGGQAWFEGSFGTMSTASPVSMQDAPPAAEPLDAATFEAIFSMLPPASYERAAVPGLAQTAGPPHPQSLTSVLSENLENLIAQTQTQAQAQEGAPLDPSAACQRPTSFDTDTLAMWSDAPVGFEWDDWGTYVTNFGGSGAPLMGGGSYHG